MSKKQLVKTYVQDVYYGDLEGSIDEVIKRLQDLKEKHGEGAELTIDYYGHDAGIDVSVYTSREETDEEFEDRIKREEMYRKNLEDNERKQLEFLKAKYGVI